MSSIVKDVERFNEKFGLNTPRYPVHLTQKRWRQRLSHLNEECCELDEAIERQDLAAIADALIDIIYVALGTIVIAGLPFWPLWNAVQRANMTKVTKKTKRHDIDIVKPPDWEPPPITEILERAGYDRKQWTDADDKIRELRCR